MDDQINNKPGRPSGSGRDRGHKLHKMNKAEVESFHKESTKMVFKNHFSYNQYIEYCRRQQISKEQANVYWNRVWNEVKERFRHDRDKLVDKHLISYWDIYNNAVREGDWSNARQTLDAIAKLQGLNEPDKLDLNSSTTIEFKFGDE
jgi:leucyl aminopeptidase (aminopeptidase T)